jgi:hypothetical protein
MFPIASYTVTANNQTFNFTNIPQTFTHLQLRATLRESVSAATQTTLYHYVNSDFSGTNYAIHTLSGNGSSVSSTGPINQPYWYMENCQPGTTGLSNVFNSLIIDVLDYTNTNKNKTLRSIYGNDQNGSGFVYLWSGLWRSTSAINQWTFTPGFAIGSRIDLYGISTSTATGA